MLLLAVAAGAPSQAVAQEPAACDSAWTARYGPALDDDGALPPRLAVGRRVYFAWVGSDYFETRYRRDFPSTMTILAGENDSEPFQDTFRPRDSFYVEPEQGDLGREYIITASWVEEPLEEENPAICRRSDTRRVHVVRGYPPRVQVLVRSDHVGFKVRQSRGSSCSLTPPGAITLTVRGPDRKRSLRLSDVCGTWSRGTGGAGWRLHKLFNYDDLVERKFPPEAWFESRYQTPGTRHFRYRIEFRHRRISSGSFDVRVQVCNFFGCEG